MQIKESRSPALLPTLEAVDAEFGCENEQCTAGWIKREGALMDNTFRLTQAGLPAQLRAASANALKESSLETTVMRHSFGRRTLRGLARFLIIFSIGIGAALAWQSYGDAARAMLASSSPQLGWLAPQTTTLTQTTPSMEVPPAADTASSELQQLTAALASMRQSVDQLAAQLAAGQQEVADNIAKLHADEQKILQKLSATPPRATAAPARKPPPATPPPSPSASPSPSVQAR